MAKATLVRTIAAKSKRTGSVDPVSLGGPGRSCSLDIFHASRVEVSFLAVYLTA